MKLLVVSFFCILAIHVTYGQQSSPCDNSKTMWTHVYTPKRLTINESCLTITGTIMNISHKIDGDWHIRVKVDEGQPNLLNLKNLRRQDGCLVAEIVCAGKPHLLRSAKNACLGYNNSIQLPEKNDHIRITGPFVTDHKHGWNEIHPVSDLEIISG